MGRSKLKAEDKVTLLKVWVKKKVISKNGGAKKSRQVCEELLNSKNK